MNHLHTMQIGFLPTRAGLCPLKTTRILAMALVLFPVFTLPNNSPGAATPVDPNASPQTKAVLEYLTNLPTGASNRIISGQYTENRGGSSSTSCSGSVSCDDIGIIYNATGKWVGFLGVDFSDSPNSMTDTQVIDYWNAGGLIQQGVHLNNPGGGDAWTTSGTPGITQLTTSGTAANTALLNNLDHTVTNHLVTLRNAGVVVLFRPLHEMNGSWFWWSTLGPTDYKTLWIYIYNYLTNTKGLHNLLWVWSPNGSLESSWYPGNEYVDVISVDLYGTITPGAISGYSSLSTTYGNKPFILGEWGACPGGLYESGCSRQDISGLIAAVKNNMPKTVAWLAWNNIYSMAYHTGVAALLNDPWVVNRDEIPSFGTTAVCGNGTKEEAEACDDGTTNGSCPRTCSSTCTVNTCDRIPPAAPTRLRSR